MKKAASRWRSPLPIFSVLAAMASLSNAEPPVHVSAYYYPWYGENGRHWDLGYDGKTNGDGPALGEYASHSSEVIRRHLAWSREFGIDNWICSWWGPGSEEDQVLRRHVLPELEASSAEAGPPVTFCLFYETAGLLGLDPERGIEFHSGTAALFAEHFRFLARTYFEHPAYLRVDGKPVVYLYLSRTFTGEFAQALTRARAAASVQGFGLYLVGDEVFWGEPDLKRIAVFDAVTSYNMHGPEVFAGSVDWGPFVSESGEIYRRYREAAASVGVGFIPGVIPGFDSRGADPTGSHYVIPRILRPGAGPDSTLEAMAEMARQHLDERLRSVAITSFNEWHEGTQVEPGRVRRGNGGEAIRRFSKEQKDRGTGPESGSQ